jgi:hypothetical protein
LSAEEVVQLIFDIDVKKLMGANLQTCGDERITFVIAIDTTASMGDPMKALRVAMWEFLKVV